MEFSFQALFWAPLLLGLLGFVEPCTVGAHLIFLNWLCQKPSAERVPAAILFVAVRTMTAGAIGIVFVALGQILIAAQTTIWLVFGAIYGLIGLAYLSDRAGWAKNRIDLAPSSWRESANPVVMGVVFGLNIPACAAPILFGLMGLVSSTGSFTKGIIAMALFGFALSAPLVIFAAYPGLSRFIEKLGNNGPRVRWILGAAFLLLGVWSIWFGLFVDPADWTGS